MHESVDECTYPFTTTANVCFLQCYLGTVCEETLWFAVQAVSKSDPAITFCSPVTFTKEKKTKSKESNNMVEDLSVLCW